MYRLSLWLHTYLSTFVSMRAEVTTTQCRLLAGGNGSGVVVLGREERRHALSGDRKDCAVDSCGGAREGPERARALRLDARGFVCGGAEARERHQERSAHCERRLAPRDLLRLRLRERRLRERHEFLRCHPRVRLQKLAQVLRRDRELPVLVLVFRHVHRRRRQEPVRPLRNHLTPITSLAAQLHEPARRHSFHVRRQPRLRRHRPHRQLCVF
mmetsp:Transcript_26689/g.87532  ORF Transcript_26689/g.87532 Transcript_26689/m.87532 type:complete len:213 (-) Transcript_26689:247-885(-)